MLSRKKDFKTKESYLQLGIDEIISIPFDKHEFIKVLDEYLR